MNVVPIIVIWALVALGLWCLAVFASPVVAFLGGYVLGALGMLATITITSD